MFKLNFKYLISSIVLLFVLIFIAMFVKDQFIRPFIGDVLVVIWMYLVLKSFLDLKYKTAASIVLVFAFSIDRLLQNADFPNYCVLQKNNCNKNGSLFFLRPCT